MNTTIQKITRTTQGYEYNSTFSVKHPIQFYYLKVFLPIY